MSEAEISALARQLVQCYGFNRSLPKPFRFALAGLSTADAVTAALNVHSAHNWTLQREDAPPWECFPGKTLIYLSGDAEEPLGAHEPLNSDVVLVIGGLVDHSAGHAGGARVGAALRVAESHRIRACKLPIENFVTVRKLLTHLHRRRADSRGIRRYGRLGSGRPRCACYEVRASRQVRAMEVT